MNRNDLSLHFGIKRALGLAEFIGISSKFKLSCCLGITTCLVQRLIFIADIGIDLGTANTLVYVKGRALF